jgi:glycolate oxidase FAD binding subunit
VDSSSLHIDGFGPLPIHRPETVTELGEEIRRARAERQAVYPLGGRTHLSLGVPPTKPGIAIETLKLNQVIDYPSRDLTITVQAGIRVLELQHILAKEGQQLAVDVPWAELVTIGGMLAVNASGPRRYGCGTVRDYLIGVSFVNDQGNEIRSGGRVVKNVAGYDMSKLLVGSLGTLGIITQATLKLRPIAEVIGVVIVRAMNLERMAEVLELIPRSQTRPCCVELRNQPIKEEFSAVLGARYSWDLTLAFEDNEPSVQWQMRTIQEELRGNSLSAFVGPGSRPVYGMITKFTGSFPVFRLRASVPPHTVGNLCGLVTAREEPWQIKAHAGNGVVLIQANVEVGKDRASDLLSMVQKFATEQGGNAVVEDCPPEWKSGLSIWGPPRNDYWLMHRIKESLDPNNIFNPGRFVDGI